MLIKDTLWDWSKKQWEDKFHNMIDTKRTLFAECLNNIKVEVSYRLLPE